MSEWDRDVAPYLILGDPSGFRIVLGQDIPEPLASELAGDGSKRCKAVIIFFEDSGDYHYIAHMVDVTQHMEFGKVNTGVKTETMHINSIGNFDVEANFIWDPTDQTVGGNSFTRNPLETDMKLDGISEGRGFKDDLKITAALTRYNATAEALVTGASVTSDVAVNGGLFVGRRYRVHVQAPMRYCWACWGFQGASDELGGCDSAGDQAADCSARGGS